MPWREVGCRASRRNWARSTRRASSRPQATPRRPSHPAALFARPTVNLRHFPSLFAGEYGKPAVHELVMAEFDDRRLADVWTGTGDISLFAARGEELADLAPVRTGAGFRASMSYSVTDVRRLDG
nr:acetoacetate decarboxylase family protein [Streptomyces sp. MBT62]